MRSERVTEVWEFYRDNCPGFKEPMRKQLRRLDEYVAWIESENAKLRELVEDMLDGIEIRAAWHRPPTEKMCEEFAQRARELGVEI